MSSTFDLDRYLARIGVVRPMRADLATLAALHRAHVSAIPFENLDIQMGHSIRLDPAALQASLVERRRGGYCFQQNGLLRLALSALGYQPRACEGRVRLDSGGAIRPRTHMVLLLSLEHRRWLVDVGFGASGLSEPIALGAPPVEQDGVVFRVVEEGRRHVLQQAQESQGAVAGQGVAGPESRHWEDLYVFEDEDVPDVDYEMGNWFTSTHPDSGFVRRLTAQRIVAGRRHILRNLTYSVLRDGAWQSRELTRAELAPTLRNEFGLDVPDAARFLAIDGAPGAGAPGAIRESSATRQA